MSSIELTRLLPVDMRYSSRTKVGVRPGCTPLRAEAKAVYKLVRTSRLYEQIVQQIEESIVKGDLKAGDQLPAERELAQRFGVSRTAVREAVKHHSGGATVARLDGEDWSARRLNPSG